ncbi:hypothetical protein [Rhizobium mongolense]|uniref:Uncharacterized protein n=1 Tax=Rhizobium mongolense TaxID=57676 RepID=A0A7W6RSS6_9HYPH|nr:hypothetical protein [Rhizobium mongolense]MBB4277248.1 hypothetical protein [Rhizobium mongolense]
MADIEDRTDAPAEPPKRKRGRPPGQPKTGGRQKATTNWTHPQIRDALLERSNAVDVLADIVAGRQLLVCGPTGKEHWARPSMQERIRATEMLLKKILPDLQAQSIEMTGKDGEPLYPPEQQDARQLSRAILAVLGEAKLDDVEEADTAHEPIPRAQHELTARRYEPVDEIAALDLTPRIGSPLADEPGETETVGNRGDFIQCLEIGSDGRSKWAIHNQYGERMTAMWATREAARASCQQFIATGMIAR